MIERQAAFYFLLLATPILAGGSTLVSIPYPEQLTGRSYQIENTIELLGCKFLEAGGSQVTSDELASPTVNIGRGYDLEVYYRILDRLVDNWIFTIEVRSNDLRGDEVYYYTFAIVLNPKEFSISHIGGYFVYKQSLPIFVISGKGEVSIHAHKRSLAIDHLITTFNIHNPGLKNIALGKSYTLSPLPNYDQVQVRRQHDLSDFRQLTDGALAPRSDNGPYDLEWVSWGWLESPLIEIVLDLEYPKRIQLIGIDLLGGGHWGVGWPSSVSFYGKSDLRNSYEYFGKVVYNMSGRLPDQGKFHYHFFALLLPTPRYARFVKVVLPISAAFADELVVF